MLTVALTDRIPYQAQVDRPRLKLPGGKKLEPGVPAAGTFKRTPEAE